jgi:hypothetical protein
VQYLRVSLPVTPQPEQIGRRPLLGGSYMISRLLHMANDRPGFPPSNRRKSASWQGQESMLSLVAGTDQLSAESDANNVNAEYEYVQRCTEVFNCGFTFAYTQKYFGPHF